MLRKQHAFGSHSVEIGRLELLLAVATEVAVAEVVGEDVDNVHWRLLLLSSVFTGRQAGKERSASE